MLGRKLLRSERGDTIVEVLIAIAVASLILVTAYVTTHHSLTTIEDTQEHSEALQLAQSQVEALRSTQKTPASGGCFNSDGTTASSSGCGLDAAGAKFNADTSRGTEFTVAITSTTDSRSGMSTYKVVTSWDSLLNPGKDFVTLYYQQ
ncbi:MAG TPA: hypothetical protein VGM08_03420 [Candidatus Saccharimonadales bacterium]|jgi:Tfp pilus assembly protein PilV